MGWDAGRIAVSGGSAGANPALGLLTLTLAGRRSGPAIRAAVLLVPAVDLSISPQAVASPIAKPFVNAGLPRMVDASYCPASIVSLSGPAPWASAGPAQFRQRRSRLLLGAEHPDARPGPPAGAHQ
jgi:acetyl esterase/lipase